MTLRFGTAGIRGPLGDGPNAVNVATVRRVATALAGFLADELARHARDGAPGAALPPPARVLVARDGRRGSPEFAAAAAASLSSFGCAVELLDGPCPTPVLAFAVRAEGADAGVMITASHNPASDNGLKVYLGGRIAGGDEAGAPIVSPTDEAIELRMEDVPWKDAEHASTIDADARIARELTRPASHVLAAYVDAIAALVPNDSASRRARSGVRVALTALHGVGGATALGVLRRAGFRDTVVVPEQHEPDAEFRTLRSPNPEDASALDRVLRLASSSRAGVALALDPDADRCAAGAPLGDRWTPISGDSLGCLLAHARAADIAAGRTPLGVADGASAFASSFVSTSLLRAIPARYDLHHAETLTGSKHYVRVPDLAFGCEEALGYCVAPEIVREKDGIATALLVAELTATLASRGRGLADGLVRLDRDYGVYRTAHVSARVQRDAADAILDRLARSCPDRMGDAVVVACDDLRGGISPLPPTPAVRLRFSDDSRVIVRPSGTEPKIKAYIEVVGRGSGDVPEARLADLAERVGALVANPGRRSTD